MEHTKDNLVLENVDIKNEDPLKSPISGKSTDENSPIPRKRGRPKGSKNKPKTTPSAKTPKKPPANKTENVIISEPDVKKDPKLKTIPVKEPTIKPNKTMNKKTRKHKKEFEKAKKETVKLKKDLRKAGDLEQKTKLSYKDARKKLKKRKAAWKKNKK